MREEHRNLTSNVPQSPNGTWGDGLMTGIVLGLILATFVWLMAYHTRISDIQDKAVEKDVACYYLDDKHEVQFAWKPNCPET